MRPPVRASLASRRKYVTTHIVLGSVTAALWSAPARAEQGLGPDAPPEEPAAAAAPTPAAILLPRLVHFEPAPYPAEAERQGLEASVVLKLSVDTSGRVLRAEVQEAAGYGFDEAAVAAA
jgi:outer membrane biosynthesis protein TonB